MSIEAMKLYCDCCDLVQPVLIAPDRDAVTGEPYEDILCAECRLVIASGTGIKQAIEEAEKRGEVVVSTDPAGNCVAVTRQDEEGKILSVIWEAEKQEPIGWLNADGSEIFFEPNLPDVDYYPSWIPLYTTPPAREWKSLTPADWNDIEFSNEFRAGAEWADVKLLEKNT